jgi:hypothetical protein
VGDPRRTARNLVAIGRLLDLIYRHLAAAGIDLALPPNELWRPAEVAAVRSRTRPERVLELVDVFRPLTATERTAITAKLQRVTAYPLAATAKNAPTATRRSPRESDSCAGSISAPIVVTRRSEIG